MSPFKYLSNERKQTQQQEDDVYESALNQFMMSDFQKAAEGFAQCAKNAEHKIHQSKVEAADRWTQVCSAYYHISQYNLAFDAVEKALALLDPVADFVHWDEAKKWKSVIQYQLKEMARAKLPIIYYRNYMRSESDDFADVRESLTDQTEAVPLLNGCDEIIAWKIQLRYE